MVQEACARQPRMPVYSPDAQASIPPPQPKQMEMPPEPEHMDIDIPVEIPDLIDVPEELLSDFDSWTHSILEYQW